MLEQCGEKYLFVYGGRFYVRFDNGRFILILVGVFGV